MFSAALVLKPLVVFVWLCSLAVVTVSIRKFVPDGKVKRLLLLHLWDD
jgi:hypothetical protein